MRRAYAAALGAVGGLMVGLGLSALVHAEQAVPAQLVEAQEAPASTLRLPGDFGSVAVVCDGTTAVYVTQEDVEATSSVAVVPYSPRCPG